MFILGLKGYNFNFMILVTQIPNLREEISKQKLLSILEDNYSTLGPIWVQSQLEWLNGIYGSFKDHDKFLIIIHLLKKTLNFYSRNFIKLTYEEFYQKNTIEISKFSISEISKALFIPKESTRRKINELKDMGVIKRFKKKLMIDRSSFKYVKPEKTIERISRFLSAQSIICVNEKILSNKLSTKNIEIIIKNNFSYIWKNYYEMQLLMMTTYKKIFNDLESFHIFCICVVSQHIDTKKLDNSKMSRNEFIEFLISHKVSGINAMSISDITGIPRATVIRKLQKLLIKNCLIIDDKKHYRLSGVFLNTLKLPQKTVFFHLANFSATVFNFTTLDNN